MKSLMEETDRFFQEKHGYEIFKKNASLSQILQQGECDVLGVRVGNGQNEIYAVDVAFHEAGLNYGPKDVTVMKVIAKMVRTAMCIKGYFHTDKAELVFASPKIHRAVLEELLPCMEELNDIFEAQGYSFRISLVANGEFNESVIQSLLQLKGSIADTSELFLRSCQMLAMFSDDLVQESVGRKEEPGGAEGALKGVSGEAEGALDGRTAGGESGVGQPKIGRLVREVFGGLLENGGISEEELSRLQDKGYCSEQFHISFPVLVKTDAEYDSVRYYSKPLTIRGKQYNLCSQWYERHRTHLEKWIRTHS